MHKVFVYGTLRPTDEQGNVLPATHQLEDYQLYSAGAFPYIVPNDYSDSRCKVKGNIIEVDKDDLAVMDNYEGIKRGLYTREKVRVFQKDNTRDSKGVNVFVYVAGPALHPQPIASGDWYSRQP